MNREFPTEGIQDQQQRFINSQPWLTDKTKQTIYKSLEYLPMVIDDALQTKTKPPELSITLLQGGEAAASYWLRSDSNESFVVKFSDKNLEFESNALKLWSRSIVRVPKFLGYGRIEGCSPLDYLVMRAVESYGALAPRVQDVLEQEPNRANDLGQKMGAELANIHNWRTNQKEQDFFPKLSDNLVAKLGEIDSYLERAEISKAEVSELKKTIQGYSTSNFPALIHGDFGVRNALLKKEWEDVFIIDPQPLFGDGLYDLAHILNIRDSSRFFLEHIKMPEPFKKFWQIHESANDGIFAGYKQAMDQEINDSKLTVYKAAEALIKAPYRERKLLEYAKAFPQFAASLFDQAVQLQRHQVKILVKEYGITSL